MRSLPEGRRAGLVAVAAGAGLLGAAAEWQGFAWSDTRSWVPDLLAGWTLAGLGVAAAATGRPRGSAMLLLTGGVAWFFGDFHATVPPWIGSVATHLSWLFLAPLVQLALAFPSGRPRSLGMWAFVTAVWLTAATPWIDWNNDAVLAATMGGLALAGIAHALRAPRERFRDAVVGLGGLILLAGWALVVPRLEPSVRSIAFDAGVALAGAWLYAGTRRVAGLAERAIELDESTGTLGSALAQILRDPGLQAGFATEDGRFVDDFGRPLRPAPPGRRTTELADDSGAVGVIVHDPRLLTSARDREAVTVAMALAGTRARMRRAVRERTDDISRSALRLIRAGDDERQRLSARLDAGVHPHVDEGARLLTQARVAADGHAELEAAVDRANAQLRRARSELVAFASGLGVPALAGRLPSAVGELVDGLPFEVELRVADLDCPSELIATIWFVCSEGVANVLKHAAASKLVVVVATAADKISVLIEDDGQGGADASGSGLGGLRDRVTALGGNLRIEPRPGGGTRLVASLPQVVPST